MVVGLAMWIQWGTDWGSLFGNHDQLSLMGLFMVIGFLLICLGFLGLYGTLNNGRRSLKLYLLIVILTWVFQIVCTILIHNVSNGLMNVIKEGFNTALYTRYESELMLHIEQTTDDFFYESACTFSSSPTTVKCKKAIWFQDFVSSSCPLGDISTCSLSAINCYCQSTIANKIVTYAKSVYVFIAVITGVEFIVVIATFIACCYDRKAATAARLVHRGQKHEKYAHTSRRP